MTGSKDHHDTLEVAIAELRLSRNAERLLEDRGVVWAADLDTITYQDLLVEGNEGTRYAQEIESAAIRVGITIKHESGVGRNTRFSDIVEDLERILAQLENRASTAHRSEIVVAANRLQGTARTILARAGGRQ